jgi:hypothetical protein
MVSLSSPLSLVLGRFGIVNPLLEGCGYTNNVAVAPGYRYVHSSRWSSQEWHYDAERDV